MASKLKTVEMNIDSLTLYIIIRLLVCFTLLLVYIIIRQPHPLHTKFLFCFFTLLLVCWLEPNHIVI